MNQPQINLAIDFLQQCQKIAQKIPLTKDIVYHLLENCSIKDYDKFTNEQMDPLHYSSDWYNFFRASNNLYVYTWGNYWTGFDNGYFTNKDEFIKIYLSLDRDHLFEGVKQLFEYINSENIEHTSKATSIVRTDNVIVRLRANDYESLKKISRYIENNKYIQEGMNNVNPFLPTVGKVGVMYDDGRSYNLDLANLIATYINQYVREGKINFSDFAGFIKERKQHDVIFLNTFNQAFFEKGPYQRVIDNTQEQTSLNSKPNVSTHSKEEFLKLALNVAFEKYGKKQAIAAIKNALAGNYSYFSRFTYDDLGNEIELRSYLENNLSKEEIKQYVLKNNDLNQADSLEDAIRNYIDHVIYERKGSIFEDALFATAQKYSDNANCVVNRINRYAVQGDETMFSRYNSDVKSNYNFRESVLRNIPPSKVYEVVEAILYSRGIDYSYKSNDEKAHYCASVIMEKIYGKQY